MAFHFVSRPPEAVGIDISDHVLRLVHLRRRRGLRLVGWSEVAVPSGVIVHGEIMRASAVVDLLKKLRSTAGRRTAHVSYTVACLPEPTCFLKLLAVTAPLEGQLGEAVVAEASSHLPIELSEAYLDWQTIGSSPTVEPGKPVQVLTGAAPRTTVERYTEVLTQARFEPVALEIEPVAIGRALLGDGESGDVAILDLGGTRSSFTVFRDAVPQFSVSLTAAGQAWTEHLAQTLRLSVDQAEEAKIKCGLGNPSCLGGVSETLEAPLKDLTVHIQEAIGYYDGHFAGGRRLGDILLAGGGALLGGLAEHLQGLLGLPVRLGDPLRLLAGQAPKLAGHALQYATAIGLAKRAATTPL